MGKICLCSLEETRQLFPFVCLAHRQCLQLMITKLNLPVQHITSFNDF